MTPDGPKPEASNGRIARLLDDLNSKDEAVRAPAQQEMRDMGPDGVRALLGYVRQEQRQIDRRTWAWTLLALLLMIALLAIMTMEMPGSHRYSYLRLLLQFCLFPLVGRFATLTARRQSLSKKAVRVLEEADDIRAIGPVLETLVTSPLSTETTPDSTYVALTRLLPRLKASDVHLLNEEQRRRLYGALNTAMIGHWDFRLAALQAIEQVGDERAVPVVERLAHGEAATRNEKRLREAARVCLSGLNARLAQQRLEQTLLRPSDAPPDPAATLLRPAQGASDADPSVLVRPVVGEAEERPS